MSFPKINDFIGKANDKTQYKRLSSIHSLNNSLARNTIQTAINLDSSAKKMISDTNQKKHPMTTNFKYEQKISTSFQFNTQDLYKLLEHLFNKKQHDLNDRNFIRRLIFQHFPQDLISAGGKDFVSYVRFQKLAKKQVIYLAKQHNQYQSADQNTDNKIFYLVLKGKLIVRTKHNQYKKSTGEFFGQIQILAQESITSIKAKTDAMLLTIKQQHFNAHFKKYFEQKYSQLQSKVSLAGSLFNLTSKYNQLQMLNSLQERQYKTGQKVIQKGQVIKQIVFLNNTEISFSQDKILNEYKATCLSEIIFMQNPTAKQTIYCMENKVAYAIKVQVFEKFMQKTLISNHFTNKYLSAATLSASKMKSISDDKTTCSNNQKSCKLQNFLRVKKVKFIGNRRRVLTQQNGSVVVKSTGNCKSSLNYPEFTTSFYFIRQKSANFSSQKKHNSIKKTPNYTSRHEQLRNHLTSTKNSFIKKKLPEQMFQQNSDPLIYNPEKIDKMQQIHTMPNYDQ